MLTAMTIKIDILKVAFEWICIREVVCSKLLRRTAKFTRTLYDSSQSCKEMSEFYLKLGKITSYEHLLIHF